MGKILLIAFVILLSSNSFPQYKNYQENINSCYSYQRSDFTAISDSVNEINEKSPFLAFILSYIFPGVGQFYNGEIVKGLLFMGGITTGVGIAVLGVGDSEHESTVNKPLVYTGFAIAAIVEIWQLIDAPVSASRINRERRMKIGNYSIELNPSFANKSLNTSIKIYF